MGKGWNTLVYSLPGFSGTQIHSLHTQLLCAPYCIPYSELHCLTLMECLPRKSTRLCRKWAFSLPSLYSVCMQILLRKTGSILISANHLLKHKCVLVFILLNSKQLYRLPSVTITVPWICSENLLSFDNKVLALYFKAVYFKSCWECIFIKNSWYLFFLFLWAQHMYSIWMPGLEA